MRLASYRAAGVDSYGAVVGDSVIDLRSLLGDGSATLKQALVGGVLAALPALLESTDAPHVALDSVELLPPIPDAGKVLCVGVNYVDHRAESGDTTIPDHPTIFARFPDTHVGHDQPVARPAVSRMLDYEGEVALVIGRGLTSPDLDDEDLLASVAGLSCYNDLSVRDWQWHNSQWFPGKNFTGVGAFGPWMTTLDEYDDLSSVRLETRVNGEVVQAASLGDLIFGFAAILRYIATFTTLEPGDVIITGTPGGVGALADPPRFLCPGDRVEVSVTGVGTLSNTITD